MDKLAIKNGPLGGRVQSLKITHKESGVSIVLPYAKTNETYEFDYEVKLDVKSNAIKYIDFNLMIEALTHLKKYKDAIEWFFKTHTRSVSIEMGDQLIRELTNN